MGVKVTQPPNPSPREGCLIPGFSDRSESGSLVANRRFAMRPGIALRSDYDAAQLWALAKATRDAGQSRRLLALAEIYDGGSRTRAARIGGVGLQTLRDWVVRFNARGPDGLIDGKAPRASRRAPRSSCGGRTRPVSARRTRSRAAGPGGEPDPAPRTISGRVRSTSSGRSARKRARAQPWCCPDAIRRP